MTQLFHFCLCSALAITAIHVIITWPDMILNSFYKPALQLTPSWLQKPLFDCMICMSSIWTTVFWFITGHHLSLKWPFVVLITAGINALICVLLEKLSEYGC
jgi:hypothetical protein